MMFTSCKWCPIAVVFEVFQDYFTAPIRSYSTLWMTTPTQNKLILSVTRENADAESVPAWGEWSSWHFVKSVNIEYLPSFSCQNVCKNVDFKLFHQKTKSSFYPKTVSFETFLSFNNPTFELS